MYIINVNETIKNQYCELDVKCNQLNLLASLNLSQFQNKFRIEYKMDFRTD